MPWIWDGLETIEAYFKKKACKEMQWRRVGKKWQGGDDEDAWELNPPVLPCFLSRCLMMRLMLTLLLMLELLLLLTLLLLLERAGQ